jgi:REP element-mobilizing transposase RayT
LANKIKNQQQYSLKITMARLPRFVLPGHPQHVIVRGNNREPIFLAEEDYRFYLDKLKSMGSDTIDLIERIGVRVS